MQCFCLVEPQSSPPQITDEEMNAFMFVIVSLRGEMVQEATMYFRYVGDSGG